MKRPKITIVLLCWALIMMLAVPSLALGQDHAPPKTGGPMMESILLPAAAMLIGSGVLVYVVLRRR